MHLITFLKSQLRNTYAKSVHCSCTPAQPTRAPAAQREAEQHASVPAPPPAITLPGQSSPSPHMISIKPRHGRESLAELHGRAPRATATFAFLTGSRLRAPNPDLTGVHWKILPCLLGAGFEQTSMATLTAGKLDQEVPYKLLVRLEKGEMQTEPRRAYQYPTVQSQATVPH